MAADKVYRVLSMYKHMLDGGVVVREDAAERYDVNVRSVMRDIADIREFLEKRSIRTGMTETVVYDREQKGYKIKVSAAPKKR